MKSNTFNCIFFFTLLLVAACIGVIFGATNTEWFLSDELFLGSIIVLGVTLASICVVIFVSTNSTRGVDAEKLDSILEAMQMSENAKRIFFRDRELQLLRKTVQDDITRGDFHAALILCDQMSNVFGAVEEAEQMRTQVQQIIHRHHEDRIRDEMKKLEALLMEHKWVEAYQYAARLRRLFPESPLLHGLEQKIADARTEYGRNLEVSFLQAANNDDIDNAMALLRELDAYLTPEDARKYKDTAATVVSTYRESLGAKFKMAVSDHRWQDAIAFGGELTHHFPNTKMAEEAHEMIETIHIRLVEDETSV